MPAKRKTLPGDLTPDVQLSLLIHPEQNATNYVPFENAAAHPFEPEATGWSPANAWWSADASWLAYLRSEDAARTMAAPAGLDCTVLAAEEIQCCLARGQGFALVAFRGTQPDNWRSIFDDADYFPASWTDGSVHRGFKAALETIWPQLDKALLGLSANTRVFFTGHSLGAALATLAAHRYPHTAGVYTFGSPRVGNQAFVASFNARMAQRSFRYVNDHDIVAQVPPELLALPFGLYAHVDELRWLNEQGQLATRSPALPDIITHVFGSPAVVLHLVQDLVAGRSASLPAALADHTPLYYALHTWNTLATKG